MDWSSFFFFRLGQDIDEDELNRELEELEQEELDKELIGVGPSTEDLPEVPSGEVKEPAAAAEKKKGNFFSLAWLTEYVAYGYGSHILFGF